MCTEAVRTQNRELVLGKSLSEFMRTLGMEPVGGVRTRLRNQMRRLFSAHVSLVYEDKRDMVIAGSQVADRAELWWNDRKPDERVLLDSKIYLGEAFFNEIIRHLTALKRCSLGLDLYLWTAYRTFSLNRPQRFSWKQLYRQFGAEPDKASGKNIVQMFRRKVLRELKKIKMAWPGLNYSTGPGVLILHPSRPAIPPVDQVQLTS